MKRPKVRYQVDIADTCPNYFSRLIGVYRSIDRDFSILATSPSAAKRIAAALNLHEAVRRGELKVVEP